MSSYLSDAVIFDIELRTAEKVIDRDSLKFTCDGALSAMVTEGVVMGVVRESH